MRQYLLTLALSGAVAAGLAGAAFADCVHETVAENASTPVQVAEEAGTSQTSASGIPGAIEVAAGSASSRGVSRPVSQPVIPTGTPMRQPITPRVPQPPAPAR